MKTLTVLLLLCYTALGERQYYSNRWAVELKEGENADLIAGEHGFLNIGKIFGNYYTFIHPKVAKRSADRSDHHHAHLSRHASVLSVQQQEIYKRSKRQSNTGLNIGDPKFPDMWYMNEHRYSQHPSLNVIDAWKQCRTGNGVTVAVVDDGIDYSNHDLKENVKLERSLNARDGSNNVFPDRGDEHGTKAAGVIAASNNDFCGIGVAYKASIAAIRIFPGEATDDIEARAFSASNIDIFSNSWGPNDDSQHLGAVGPLAAQAIKNRVEYGRGGKGAIFVFSGGSGGIHGDSCAYDGYVNSRYTIAVNPVTRQGEAPPSTEACSAIMVTSYSGTNMRRDGIWTTGRGYDGCTGKFKDSSAAAPFVSGAIALALEANPSLGWRDIQHLLTLTSNSNVDFRPSNWIRNAAGFKVSPTFGFGLLDIGKLVAHAKTWVNLREPAKECDATLQGSFPMSFNGVSRVYGQTTMHFSLNNCGISYLEHVLVTVDISFCARGFFSMKLKSPRRTESLLLPGRQQDYKYSTLNWTVSSVAFWGENPNGLWELTIEGTDKTQQYLDKCREGVVDNVKIVMYGSGFQENPRNNFRPASTEYNCNVEDNTKKIASCAGTRFRGPLGYYTDVLDITSEYHRPSTPVWDLEECKRICLNSPECLSIVYVEGLSRKTRVGYDHDDGTGWGREIWERVRNPTQCVVNYVPITGTPTMRHPTDIRGRFYKYERECRGNRLRPTTSKTTFTPEPCRGDLFQRKILDSDQSYHTALDIPESHHSLGIDVNSELECRTLCARDDNCHSVTVVHKTTDYQYQCYKNYVNSVGTPTRKVPIEEWRVYVFDKICARPSRTRTTPRPAPKKFCFKLSDKVSNGHDYQNQKVLALSSSQHEVHQVSNRVVCERMCRERTRCRSYTYGSAVRRWNTGRRYWERSTDICSINYIHSGASRITVYDPSNLLALFEVYDKVECT